MAAPHLATVFGERRCAGEDRAEPLVRCLAAPVLDRQAVSDPRCAGLTELVGPPPADGQQFTSLCRDRKAEPEGVERVWRVTVVRDRRRERRHPTGVEGNADSQRQLGCLVDKDDLGLMLVGLDRLLSEPRGEVASVGAVALDAGSAEPAHTGFGHQAQGRVDVEPAAGDRTLEGTDQAQIGVAERCSPMSHARHSPRDGDQQA